MTTVARITNVVQRLLSQRAISRIVAPEDDLREVGLSSMDMLNLVLAIEAEFDLTIPESGIAPANFRCIAAIGELIFTLSPQS